MNQIKTMLKAHYDIDGMHVFPQQGGWSALAYKVCTTQHAYFLKVYEKSRASTPKWTALIDNYVPILMWLLHHSGLKGKIPVPLLTNTGHYQCEDENGIYLLYEYIHGETIGDNVLTREQVSQLSEIIAELHCHGEDIPMGTDAVKEDFQVPFLQPLTNILDMEYCKMPSEVRERLQPYIGQIQDLVHTVIKLSGRLKNGNVNMALCHTDLHHWNLMQSEQQLMLIDWEGLKLAPVEADMMFLVHEPYYDQFMSIYQKYHHDYVINADALQFYQGRRKLEDIWEFLEQLLYDMQDAKQRKATLNNLTKELQDINN